MGKRFLQREVKKDGKGLYVHYGPCRLRALSKKTRFNEGDIVSMMVSDSLYKNPLEMCVFNNVEEYELWRTKI